MAELSREIERIRYPHMVKEEVEIWKRFLILHGKRFDRFRYDVHVGKGIGRIPGYEKKYQDLAITLTQKRIDVVAYRGGLAYIIEIKQRAGLSAIGQLVSYRKLYQERYGPGTVSGLAIVATSIDPDVRDVARSLNIETVTV